jgi:hypothetical protein
MPLNPNIALSVKGIEVQDPLAQYGKIAAIQGAQSQNALAQYQLGSAQRAENVQNVLSSAYSQSVDPATGKIDYNKLNSLIAAGGAGAQLPAIQKSRMETETAQIEMQKKQSDLIDAKLKQSRQFLDTINPNDPNAPAQYIAWHKANHSDPVLGPVLAARGITADQSMASIQKAVDKGPQALADLINQSKLGSEKFMEMNKPTIHSQDIGGATQLLSVPGLGGAATPIAGSQATKTMTPYEMQHLKVQQGQLAVAQQRLQAEMATGNLTEPTIDFIAETYRQTGTLPPMGMGPMAAAARAKILTRAGELAMGGGQTAAQAATDVRTSKAETAGMTAGQRVIGGQMANVQLAANETTKMLDVAKPYVAKVNPTDYPVLNAAGNFVAKNTGDPNIVGLATSLNAIVNTYARAINPKGTATVSDKNHAREILNTAMSKGQLNEAFNVMGQEMNASLASGPEVRAGMRSNAASATPVAGGMPNIDALLNKYK